MRLEHMKIYLTSLILRQMQVKTHWNTMLFIRLAKAQKLNKTFCFHGCGKRHSHIASRNAKCRLRGIWQKLRKLHMHLSFNLAIPILGIYPEDIPHNSTKIHMYKAKHYNIIFRKPLKCLGIGNWLIYGSYIW